MVKKVIYVYLNSDAQIYNFILKLEQFHNKKN
jgi:hypothetical protein